MADLKLTDRQQREVDFYEEYAQIQRVEEVDLSPVTSNESRPWNPYWYVYGRARQRFVSPTQRLLEFGCGIGIAAIRFATIGYEVWGFDISPDNLEIAKELAKKHNVADRCHFKVMPAERLSYESDFFDLITGVDILHHIEIPVAIKEAHRVLKPGGIAIFKEHVEAPIVDPLRNTRLVQAIAPSEKSLEHHITDDERKLNRDDLQIICNQFSRVEQQRFTILSRLDRLIPKAGDGVRGRLQQLDRKMMQICPLMARLGGTVVLTCQKEPQTVRRSRRRAA